MGIDIHTPPALVRSLSSYRVVCSVPPTELEFAENLAGRLAPYGTVELVYLTAEFQPFSNAQRPDLHFIPGQGGRSGQHAVIELKSRASPGASGRSFLNIIEHKEFCEEALGLSVFRYVFVTGHEPPEFSRAQLEKNGVVVIVHQDDAAATSAAILRELLD